MSRKPKRTPRAKKGGTGPTPSASTEAKAATDGTDDPGGKRRGAKGRARTVPATPTAPRAEVIEPIAVGLAEWVWFAGAVAVVTGVALYFQLTVNRVFDVPKAFILKVGGCGLFAAWWLYALFGPGVRWRSARTFAAPVAAMTLAVMISTFFSVDFSTSFNGVYERQFGLQGFLACVGLFFLTSTGLAGKRGAWLGIGVLAVLGSTVGVYATFQAFGWDPWPFFWNKPHNKVYAFLGNATFAGNALALIVPMVTVAGGVATAVTLFGRRRIAALPSHAPLWALGFVSVLVAQIAPGRAQALQALSLAPQPPMPPQYVTVSFVVGVGIAMFLLAAPALLGTWGPQFTRLGERKSRQQADAFGAGALCAMVIGILLGLLFTRTRGAWVGTLVAAGLGSLLLPQLAAGTSLLKPARAVVWGIGAALVATFSVYVWSPSTVCGPQEQSACWLYARTIRSIPAAFDPDRIDYGKGQGTRRFLWTESPRVLYNHAATLERYYDDRADYAAHVDTALSKELKIEEHQPYSDGYKRFDTGWRSAVVWLTGIGIETYRYAFMSHKSLRLEALDPMTNHDNPHNNYLYVLASFGLLGLAAYGWLLVSLLWQAFRRFWAAPQPLLTPDAAGGFSPTMVDAWRFEEANRDPKGKLLLETDHPDVVADAVRAAMPDWDTQIENGAVVVRGYDPDAAPGQLAMIDTSWAGGRADRAMAFGVVTSFFSYAVYSIAGFDSVACSVFLFFLLGCAAVLFQPNLGEAPADLVTKAYTQWRAFRGLPSQAPPPARRMAIAVGVAAVMVPLLLVSMWRANVVLSAEKALVKQGARPKTRRDVYEAKIKRTQEAVRLNPSESFYKQSLGNAYGELATYFDAEARLRRRQKPGTEQQAILQAAQSRKKAEQALYAALDHAWAPENVYISLFQLYYRQGDLERAEAALERALVHSPHLGAVRANLASLQLERKALDEALANAKWVAEVSPSNAMAWRTAGRVYQLRGQNKAALDHYKVAMKRSKGSDRLTKRYIAEVEKALSSTSAR